MTVSYNNIRLTSSPLLNIPHGYAQFIMADPPWHFENWSRKGIGKGAAKHYDTMSLSEIKQLPVSEIAASDCMLFLWAVWPMIDQALEVVNAWGFTYKTGGVWAKLTKNGLSAFGTGYLLRSANEPFLIATRGKTQLHSKSHRNQINGLAREHSRKPEEAYSFCETYMPDARRVELFARMQRPGWLAWGHETEKFNDDTNEVETGL
jgi:N6-adenosine-specific RNA methylase IME4